MVQPKNPPKRGDIIREMLDDFEERNPIIDTRYYVSEITPAYRWSDEYDDYWEHASSKVVSPFFTTEQEAEEWMGQHVPDEGKTLAVYKQYKRRTIIERWW
jgi:hypothetical protein